MAKNHAAVALGKLGGSSTSEAKRAASRANGKKGGARLHKPKASGQYVKPDAK